MYMETSKLDNLYNEFPRLYVKEDGRKVYFECGPGWYDLLRQLSKELMDIMPADYELSVTQVKEKYGTLRFYVDFATDEIWDLIHRYEDKSGVTCEVCGQPGSLDKHKNWYSTLCDNHKRERSTS